MKEVDVHSVELSEFGTTAVFPEGGAYEWMRSATDTKGISDDVQTKVAHSFWCTTVSAVG
jgi:hypothetical protein